VGTIVYRTIDGSFVDGVCPRVDASLGVLQKPLDGGTRSFVVEICSRTVATQTSYSLILGVHTICSRTLVVGGMLDLPAEGAAPDF